MAAPQANPAYGLAQLSRALRAAEINKSNAKVAPETVAKAQQRADAWIAVYQGMASGALTVGSRAPIAGIPNWVTPQVVTGGFATGALMAEGPLQPHEEEILRRLPLSAGTDRQRLNSYFLTEEGILELKSMLVTGCYRVNVPEEGALLAVAWLLLHEKVEDADAVLKSIVPLFPRLRFYPVPAATPLAISSTVSLENVGQVKKSLALIKPNPVIARMTETVNLWRPLEDEFVLLYLKTLNPGEQPPLCSAPGAHKKAPPLMGGTPCHVFPAGWREKAEELSHQYDTLCKEHQRSNPLPGGNAKVKHLHTLEKLLKHTRTFLATKTFSDGVVRDLRRVLGEVNRKRGLPGSEKLTKIRASMKACVANKSNDIAAAQMMIKRLSVVSDSEGLDSVEPFLVPVTSAEARTFKGLIPNAPLAPAIVRRVQRARKDDIYSLVDHGLVPSSEVLAILIPQVSAQVRTSVFSDTTLRQLYGCIYLAFSRRRSLLLLNLEAQTKLTELPWIIPLEKIRAQDKQSGEAAAKEALSQLSAVAIESFPETILPNKLIGELQSLVTTASLTKALPLVEELAVDIFMGAFSPKFVSSACIAASFYKDTLYAKYYSINCEKILALESSKTATNDFYLLCKGRTPITNTARYLSLPENGMILEQTQIVTTHNLAALFVVLNLKERLGSRLCTLPRTCFSFIVKTLSHLMGQDWKSMLIDLKNTSYAWRQMVFFLALLPKQDQEAFCPFANEEVTKIENEGVKQRLGELLGGLTALILEGKTPKMVYLGWVQGRHFLLGPKEDKKDEKKDDKKDDKKGSLFE